MTGSKKSTLSKVEGYSWKILQLPQINLPFICIGSYLFPSHSALTMSTPNRWDNKHQRVRKYSAEKSPFDKVFLAFTKKQTKSSGVYAYLEQFTPSCAVSSIVYLIVRLYLSLHAFPQVYGCFNFCCNSK